MKCKYCRHKIVESMISVINILIDSDTRKIKYCCSDCGRVIDWKVIKNSDDRVVRV